MMSKFQGLNGLCRLHCSTKPKRCQVAIQRDVIGFTGCFVNNPKGEIEVIHPVTRVLSETAADEIELDTKTHFRSGRVFQNVQEIVDLATVVV
jgi:hypothetical protein